MKFHEKLVNLRKEKGWFQTAPDERVCGHIVHFSCLENAKSQTSVDMLWKII